MPSVSPLATVMSTWRTAFTMPRRVANSTVSPETSRSALMFASRPPLRIDDVAKTVADQVEAKHREHQREARKKRDPPFARDDRARALGDHDAPFGRRRTHA